jgi:hypothetical protein
MSIFYYGVIDSSPRPLPRPKGYRYVVPLTSRGDASNASPFFCGYGIAADRPEVRSYGHPMQGMRIWISSNRRLALALLLLTLCVKAAIPVGYMVSSSPDRVVTVSICADATGGLRQMQMVIPGKDQGDSHSGNAKMDGQCAFSSLNHATLDGADAFLLALAIAFILALGFLPTAQLHIAQLAYLRPPLRGPPVAV